jgi:hypothetical protein
MYNYFSPLRMMKCTYSKWYLFSASKAILLNILSFLITLTAVSVVSRIVQTKNRGGQILRHFFNGTTSAAQRALQRPVSTTSVAVMVVPRWGGYSSRNCKGVARKCSIHPPRASARELLRTIEGDGVAVRDQIAAKLLSMDQAA